MRMRLCGGKVAVCLLGVSLLVGGSAFAQRGGGGGGGDRGGGMGPGGPGGGMGPGGPGGMGQGPGGPGGGPGMGGPMGGEFPGGGPRGGDRGGQAQPGGQQQGGLRIGGGPGGIGIGGPGGLQMGPPGRWWDDNHYVQALKLRPEQQRRMDNVFDNNRPMLQQSLTTLQQEQARLAALEQAKPTKAQQRPVVDQQAVFDQIDRVSAARVELEKAYAHMLLQLRKEMDPKQISDLEKTQ